MGAVARVESVELEVPWDRVDLFFPMLQRGVEILAQLGRPLKELLLSQLGIEEEYVAGRITTIFLDNRPVDDMERSLIHQGSRVTLSAAMPGLVGATMRRSGFYASFRQGISHAETGVELKEGEGVVRLKLFNLLLPELGPLLLARGILVGHDQLEWIKGELEGRQDAIPLPGDGERLLLTVRFSGTPRPDGNRMTMQQGGRCFWNS